ncbi:MAG: Coenzyme F420 hydrogenase/dehydrogenase, beta subunit C-terminal domain [Candidatus Omnitrophota bacterium]|jgi:coenzyme F420 hydrogenase subunit beta
MQYESNQSLQCLSNIYSSYLAWSTDNSIRYSASSGGFCKGFLLYLLECKKVDAAILTRTGSVKSPLVPETVISSSIDEIKSTRTNSVYAPTDPLKVLGDLDKNKTYAFIGLPCHCKALRAIQKTNKFKNITIVIGLLCGCAPKIGFTKKNIRDLRVDEKDIVQIEYRGNGWPGKFTVHLKDGTKKQINHWDAFSSSPEYLDQHCKRCSLMPVYSDVSLCDPWNLKLEESDKYGVTVVICWNEKIDALVRLAQQESYIGLKDCTKQQATEVLREHLNNKIDRHLYGKNTAARRMKSGFIFILRAVKYIFRKVINTAFVK